MTISVKSICDSVSPAGIRITTMQIRYPRFIHAEFMTHRKFSRSASSSRAIPVKRMIEDLQRDPAMPIHWGSNKSGMQAGAELNIANLASCKELWYDARDHAIRQAERLMAHGLHKQIANRILEPWGHINVVCTATNYANFYHLRSHPDAQPEIRELSDMMRSVQEISTPTLLRPGEWHLPYIRPEDYAAAAEMFPSNAHQIVELLKKVSVARCARVSYLTHEGKVASLEAELELYDRLVGSEPLHASPAEHQATPDYTIQANSPIGEFEWNQQELHGNFEGWIQFRKTLKGESVEEPSYEMCDVAFGD